MLISPLITTNKIKNQDLVEAALEFAQEMMWGVTDKETAYNTRKIFEVEPGRETRNVYSFRAYYQSCLFTLCKISGNRFEDCLNIKRT